LCDLFSGEKEEEEEEEEEADFLEAQVRAMHGFFPDTQRLAVADFQVR